MESLEKTPPLLPAARRHRIALRRFGWIAAGVIALPALLYLHENRQGRGAWRAYVAEAEAAGERLELEALIPPPIPDETNFAMAPLLLALFADKATGEYRNSPPGDPKQRELIESLKLPEGEDAPQPAGHWRKGERPPLHAWREHLAARSEAPLPASTGAPAADVLRALERFDPVMRQLREAAARPKARFPLRYQDGVHMHLPLSPLQDLAKIAQLRASARLAAGDGEGAYSDLQLVFRLGEAIGESPVLITHLVEMQVRELGLIPLWEGMLDHRWSGEQLRELQERCAGVNYGAQVQRAIRMERSSSGFMIDLLRQRPWEIGEILALTEQGKEKYRTLEPILRAAPSGWFDLNKAELGQLLQRILEFADVEPPRFHPERVREFKDHLKGSGSVASDPRKLVARRTAPIIAAVVEKSAAAQGTMDLALAALALERHWLRHGAYPGTLEKLDEDLRGSRGIPPDCITGHPPHYRSTEDGRFLLYYEGWNQRDDGGEVVYKSPKSPKVDFTKGDWVWPQPLEP